MEKKPPKKISPTYLQNAALHYLQRYATSAGNLRRVLMRKIKKSCLHHGHEVESFIPLVDDLINRYISSGLLDDASFARAKTATLRRQGKSQRMIEAKLTAKGLMKTDIVTALQESDAEGDAEFDAALALTRKKKLGKFRLRASSDPDISRKDMAVLGRAGFSYAIARKALNVMDDKD